MADTSKYTISLSAPATLTATLGAGKINVNDYTLAVEEAENGVKLTLTRGNKTETVFIPDGAKGDKGDTGAKGEKGDKGDKGPKGDPGSDANVTAENIQSALGYAPVSPTALDKKQDVLTEVDQQTITKTGMTSGAAWTAAEQKAARDRMGVDKAYELIEEIILSESVTQVVRTNMSLAEMRIAVEVPVSDSVSAVAIEIYSGSILIGYGYIGNFISKDNIKIAKFSMKRDHGVYVFSQVVVNANSASQKAGVSALNETASLFPVGNAITKVSLYSTSNAIPLPIATKITIEGETT